MPGLGSVSSGLLHQEISRLNSLLEEKMSECERMEGECNEIRRKGQEQIQTLEQQVGAPPLSLVHLGLMLHLCHLKKPKQRLLQNRED